ncbi:2-hydroxyacyl-CoA dehydratase subunit D [Microbacterium sp. A93]|uniref:2-hydroxyacyl-CoA dehydratase subunit D n=1 Tax=Microbacterium sp. A93 TaxID=3450716 RepID=UPI003F41F20C
MNRNDAFNVFHSVVENRWDASVITELSGGVDEPVAGFLDTGFPEELAMAAGYRPMLLTGDLAVAPDRITEHLDVSAPARIRYLYEALVTGRHDDCDLLCVTGGDRWIGESAGFFEVYSEVFGAPDIAHTLYLERARGTFAEHREYNREGMVRFAEEISAISPQRVTFERMWDAIRVTNRTRALLQKVEALRIGDTPRISGVDATVITLAAMLMPKAAFNDLLERALAAVEGESATVRHPRIFVTGSSVDHVGFIQMIEDLGAVVIGEDTEFGMRYAHTPVAESLPDPFEALADRWTYKFPESWGFGRERRITQRVEMAVRTEPDAVIAVHLRGDTSFGWDYPDQADALRAYGIPTLALIDTDYELADAVQLRESVASFLSSLGVAAAQDAHERTEEKE